MVVISILYLEGVDGSRKYWSYWSTIGLNCVHCTKSCYQIAAPCLQAECHFSLSLCSSMVLSLADTWGECGAGLAPRVPSLKELMALPCIMQSCRLMKNCGRAPHLFICHLSSSSMVLFLVASWGDYARARVPNLKEGCAGSSTVA